MTKEIIFLNRAYNDLDIQLSLIEAFAKDPNFSVRVIGYPCDGGIGRPDQHEAVHYMQEKYRVSFETMLDAPPAPRFLRTLHAMTTKFMTWRQTPCGQQPLTGFLLKLCHVALLRLMRFFFLKGDQAWVTSVSKTWNPSAIILDEVYAQPGRSYVTDVIVPHLQNIQNIPVYIIQTGHNIYKIGTPSGQAKPHYRPTKAQKFFLPSQLDYDINIEAFPNEAFEIAGNLRMDKEWLHKLHASIIKPPYYPADIITKTLPQQGKPKIAFMLSKLNYGIEIDALKETIETLGHKDGVAVALKPHTRGMKFDFMTKEQTGHAVIAAGIPSPLLIEWADLVLFTGSSVVYHTMLQNKPSGFLKYCQHHETVFDKGHSAIAYESLSQLLKDIDAFHQNSTPFVTKTQQESILAHLVQEVYAGDPDGHTAQTYKKMIMKDLQSQPS